MCLSVKMRCCDTVFCFILLLLCCLLLFVLLLSYCFAVALLWYSYTVMVLLLLCSCCTIKDTRCCDVALMKYCRYLVRYDCVGFHSFVESLRHTDGALGPVWIMMEQAHNIFKVFALCLHLLHVSYFYILLATVY